MSQTEVANLMIERPRRSKSKPVEFPQIECIKCGDAPRLR